ncbi:prepilin peptidase [uncultured Granulicatella sp.]|uniref:prepilin peptidase n=1 Tax=uncultured Granulicatella sp. TaxID=316089 RepID=UPI0028E4FBAC|nr:prepilin peptidase [uncultured Granulicatella sp.]
MWIWSFVVGCCIGSFLNVVALRLQREEDFIRGHSHCVECLHELSWKDLIPVLSWIWLRGKCRYCGRDISSRYWVVEVVSGCMFMLMTGIWNGREWRGLLDLWLLGSLAIFCSLTDLQEQVIYPKGLAIVGLLHIIIELWSSLENLYFLSTVMAVIFYGGIYIVGYLLWKEEVFGLGDCYYLATVALWYPVKEIVLIGLLSFVVGGGILGLLLVWKKERIERVAFVPFITIAQLLVMILGVEWFGW